MEVFGLLVRLAARSLLAHRVKSAFVGALLAAGTFLVVSGSALLGSVQRSMEVAITGSVAGHLQVYDSRARDPLHVMGGFGLGASDVGEVEDFRALREALADLEGIEAIVPLGIVQATVFGRNEIDQVLIDLRSSLRDPSDAAGARRKALVARVRRIVQHLEGESAARDAMIDPEVAARTRADLDTASDPAFWASFDTDPLAALDFLDSRIAPLATDGALLYLRLIGTDPERFAQEFDRFHLVDGVQIPPGKRGILFSKRTYELLIKNPAARELDALLDLVRDDGATLADPVNAQRVQRLVKQYRRITFQLDPAAAPAVEAGLRALLPEVEGDLDTLVQAFLAVDDDTVAARHAWFTEHVAPHIALYTIPVGGEITLRGFSTSGYVKSVNVPVYGTYELEGLEGAGLAAAANLTDLVTFRELYGKMSDRDRAELAEIKADAGVREVSRDDAEAMFFGGGEELVAAAGDGSPIQPEIAQVAPVSARDATYPPEELDAGLVLSAAVILEDPGRIAEVQRAIEARIAERGLPLQVVDWKAASGMIGQFIVVMRLVLLAMLSIIFLVALILINNAMVTATLDRTGEIGTMRAIGVRRAQMLALVLLETTLLAGGAGIVGCLVAVAFIGVLGQVGIPAAADILVLLFAGDHLYPRVEPWDLAFGWSTIACVAVLSTIWPALMAARVPPIVAMQTVE